MDPQRLMSGLTLASVLAVASLTGGCEYFQKSSAFIADGIGTYCAAASGPSRELIRQELDTELRAEGIEICLGCPGDAETICVGEPRPKVRAKL